MQNDPFDALRSARERLPLTPSLPPPPLSSWDPKSALRSSIQAMPVSTPTPAPSVIERLEKWVEAAQKQMANGKLKAPECAHLIARLPNILVSIFGEKSPIIRRFVSLSRAFAQQKSPISIEMLMPCVSEVSHLLHFLRSASDAVSLAPISVSSVAPKTKQVFIIHGHDKTNRLQLHILLKDHFKLEPVAILSQPGQSQVTIQKFENAASGCAFAIALLTPDDVIQNQQSGSYGQARPNAIFEAGWFIGRLGKERVLLLVKQGTRLHSDFDGVNRIEFQENVEDKFLQIKQELEASGLVGG